MRRITDNSKKQVVLRAMFVGALALVFCALAVVEMVSAYFNQEVRQTVPVRLRVNDLFGRLNDELITPGAPWGKAGNPYLITVPRHLRNLYFLQNTRDTRLINDTTVFQVSNEDGTPCFVGGDLEDPENLFDMYSIGTEDFPFVSELHGVTDAARPITLPGGQVTDTSTLGNIRVNAYDGQIDVGLFGYVGRPDPLDPDGTNEQITTTGEISNLLLVDIQISTDQTGAIDKMTEDAPPEYVHPDFFTAATPHETNHMGILAGHAEYCMIRDISVYYTVENENATVKQANVKAFNVFANESNTRYTTAGGILGYYKQIVVSPDEKPVNSDGNGTAGGGAAGFGLGIIYSKDIWDYMEQVAPDRTPIAGEPTEAYGLQDNFDANNLYTRTQTVDGQTKAYFQIGVFTFVHSRQSLNVDRVAKLWEPANPDGAMPSDPGYDPTNGGRNWTVSDTGTYTLGAPDTVYNNAKQYTCTQLTYNYNGNTNNGTMTRNNTAATPQYFYPNANPYAANANQDYRYMIVYEIGGIQYALTKNGETAAMQKIDTANFVIPDGQLEYYTFRVASNRRRIQPDAADGRRRYEYGTGNGPMTTNANPNNAAAFNYGTNTLRTQPATGATGWLYQYLCYGQTVTNGAGVVVEEERPLRIFDTASFMYASGTGDPTPEGLRVVLRNTAAATEFSFQRQGTGTAALGNYFLSFSVGTGFNGGGTATYAKIYAVNVTPVNNAADYNKEHYVPSGASTTYDMSQNVLFYRGNYNSANPAEKYRYQVRSIESLNWPDNQDLPITSVESALKMADPSSFYYMYSTYYGVLRDIPGEGSRKIYAPRGGVAFTVNGTGVANDRANINVIVASDPYQLVDQAIEVSYFPTNVNTGVPNNNTSTTDARTIVAGASFALPPVPGSPTAGTSLTVPIRVTDDQRSPFPAFPSAGVVYRDAYPNMNTLLVAYTLSVPCTANQTYFLTAPQGSANFVYFSVDKTATNDSNPHHKNDVMFGALNGIDYVNHRSYGAGAAAYTQVLTVNHTDYLQSLVLPYFGLTNAGAVAPDIMRVMDAKYFDYNILRYYSPTNPNAPSTPNNPTHVIYINVDVYGHPPPETYKNIINQLMNFNYTGWSYVDTQQLKRVYSDVMVLSINGTEVDWRVVYAP